jgi:hypothetical protein
MAKAASVGLGGFSLCITNTDRGATRGNME